MPRCCQMHWAWKNRSLLDPEPKLDNPIFSISSKAFTARIPEVVGTCKKFPSLEKIETHLEQAALDGKMGLSFSQMAENKP